MRSPFSSVCQLDNDPWLPDLRPSVPKHKRLLGRHDITNPLTCTPSNGKTPIYPPPSTLPKQRRFNIMTALTTKPCANCNTPSAQTHLLKRCGKCKDVNYCNEICQKADWQAHKSACDQTSSTIATLKEVLLEDGGRLKLVKKTLARGSFALEAMPPTPELPLGYQDVIVFPPEWLASIAHLPKGKTE